MTATIQIVGAVKTNTNGQVVIETGVYDLPTEIRKMTEDSAPVEVECNGGRYTISGRGKSFRATRWENGRAQKAEMVYLYVSSASPSRQQQERAWDAVQNEGHDGYNPHRLGDRKTY